MEHMYLLLMPAGLSNALPVLVCRIVALDRSLKAPNYAKQMFAGCATANVNSHRDCRATLMESSGILLAIAQ
jgi:hypothetical protein